MTFRRLFYYEPVSVRSFESMEDWLNQDLDKCVQQRLEPCNIPHGEMVDHQVVGLYLLLVLYASRTLAVHRNNQSMALCLWLQKAQWRHKKHQAMVHISSNVDAVWRIIRAILAL